MSGGVAVIPARGGSSRVPRKNILPFAGKPMIAHPIETARASGLFSEIYVSTEDDEISAIARKHGARIIRRPPALALNEIGTQQVMQHAMQFLNLRLETEVCCIYATTPLLVAVDLKKARALLDEKCHYVIAVEDGPDLKDIGWFYYGRARYFAANTLLWGEGTRMYRVEKCRAIDINTIADVAAAEAAYRAAHKNRRAA